MGSDIYCYGQLCLSYLSWGNKQMHESSVKDWRQANSPAPQRIILFININIYYIIYVANVRWNYVIAIYIYIIIYIILQMEGKCDNTLKHGGPHL